jgi:ketosteroid isomerase-like protein
MTGPLPDILATIRAWDQAMITNDADAIGRFMAPDWVIIGPDGHVDGRERFLALIRSGDLTHNVMESREIQVKALGDVAFTIAEGTSGGEYRGQSFHLVERVSCLFHLAEGAWLCHSTHLSLIRSAPDSA